MKNQTIQHKNYLLLKKIFGVDFEQHKEFLVTHKDIIPIHFEKIEAQGNHVVFLGSHAFMNVKFVVNPVRRVAGEIRKSRNQFFNQLLNDMVSHSVKVLKPAG